MPGSFETTQEAFDAALLALSDKDADAESVAEYEAISCARLKDMANHIQNVQAQLHRGHAGEAAALRMETQQTKRKEDYTTARTKLHRARQQARQRLQKKARDELLMGGDVVLRKRQEKKVENEARKAEALNQQLRDTNRTMKEQLDQSKATLDGITQGGATMKKIAGKLDDMDEDINASHALLSKFGGQVFWDRVWIGAALMVYLSVLAYVVYRRTGLHYIAGPAFNFIFQLVTSLVGGADAVQDADAVLDGVPSSNGGNSGSSTYLGGADTDILVHPPPDEL